VGDGDNVGRKLGDKAGGEVGDTVGWVTLIDNDWRSSMTRLNERLRKITSLQKSRVERLAFGSPDKRQ